MIKKYFMMIVLVASSQSVFAVETLTGQAEEAKAAQTEQKTKQNAVEKSFEEKRAELTKKHKEKKAKKESKATPSTEEPALKESKEIIHEQKVETQGINVREDTKH